MKSYWLQWLLVAAAAVPGSAHGQGAASLADLIRQRDAEIRKVQTAAAAQKADLFDNYARALDAPMRQFTAKGDLDSVLIVKAEIDSARLKRNVGKTALPALDSYRATLRKTLEGIDSATARSQAQIDAGYLHSLNQLKVDLTKAGKVEEAVAVDKEIKNVNAGTAPSAATASTGAGAGKGASAQGPGAPAKPIDFTRALIGKVMIPVDAYRQKEPIYVGTQGENKGSFPPGMVYLQPGTEVDGTPIYVREGMLSADRTMFKDCRLVTELHGTFDAKNSILRDCTMAKGGKPFVNLFSSKWSFENCVIIGTFFAGRKLTDYGLKATRCTFHDIDFLPPIYKRDAGAEVTMEWQNITRCKFIDCVIPETLFLATKDCVFVNCRFVESKEPYPISTPIKVKAYISSGTKVPPAPAKCTYEIRDAGQATQDVGGDLKYEKMGKAVKFL